jgi:hypothetical protein
LTKLLNINARVGGSYVPATPLTLARFSWAPMIVAAPGRPAMSQAWHLQPKPLDRARERARRSCLIERTGTAAFNRRTQKKNRP